MRFTVRRAALVAITLTGCYLSHEVGSDGSVPHTDSGIRDAGRDGAPPDMLTFDSDPRDFGTDTMICTRPMIDAFSIGNACDVVVGCPMGLECTALFGAVLDHRCEIPCASDCDCPPGSTCEPFTDKSGTRLFCSAPPILI